MTAALQLMISLKIQSCDRYPAFTLDVKKWLLTELKFLNQVLTIAIPKVMLSCNKDNVASSKTIISCGGVLTEESLFEGIMQQVFWIDLA